MVAHSLLLLVGNCVEHKEFFQELPQKFTLGDFPMITFYGVPTKVHIKVSLRIKVEVESPKVLR